MGTCFYLANEGFGFNLDILDTNLINLAILAGLLVFYGGKFLGNILTERSNEIAEAIKGSEKRAELAAAELAEAQQKLAQAQAEAEKIHQNALNRAHELRESILAQGEADVERLKQTANQELSTETERVIAQIKEQIVAQALQKAEADLQNRLDDKAQAKLVERSIMQLGGS